MLVEIRQNKEVWQKKVVLRQAYAELYRLVCEQLSSVDGPVAELGVRNRCGERIYAELHHNGYFSESVA